MNFQVCCCILVINICLPEDKAFYHQTFDTKYQHLAMLDAGKKEPAVCFVAAEKNLLLRVEKQFHALRISNVVDHQSDSFYRTGSLLKKKTTLFYFTS